MAKGSGKGGGGSSKGKNTTPPATKPEEPKKPKTGMAENKNWHGMKPLLWVVGLLIVFKTLGVIGNDYTNSNTSGNQSDKYNPTELKEIVEKKMKEVEPDVAKALKVTHYPDVKPAVRDERIPVQINTRKFSLPIDLHGSNGCEIGATNGILRIMTTEKDHNGLIVAREYVSDDIGWLRIEKDGGTTRVQVPGEHLQSVSFKSDTMDQELMLTVFYR